MASKRILVIDDSPTILKVVQLVLTKAGFEVSTAADGEAGINAARKDPPDMILLDFVMPKMNGYQVCRALSEDEELNKIPVVLMSAKGDQVGERFVKVMGIVDYITKPFSPEAITAVVTHTVSRGFRREETDPAALVIQELAEPTNEELVKAADAAGTVRRAALVRFREGLIKALAAVVDERGEYSPSIAEDALTDNILEGLLGELRTSAPELAEVGTPVLVGDLRVVPLADVLSLLQSQMQSGILTVIRGGARIELHFRAGKIDLGSAFGMPDEFRLGRFITDEALIAQDDLDELIAEPEGGLLGSQLVKRGMLSREELGAALIRQTSEIVYELLRWNFGRFTFRNTKEITAAARQAKLDLSVDGILMEGYRRVDEWHLIEREVDTFDLVFLRNDDAILRMGRGRLTREELAVLELVNGKNTVKDIIRQSRMSSFDVSKMLYRLLSIKLIRKRVMPVAV